MTKAEIVSEIADKTGVDIATIFEYEGENGFREREKKILAELCKYLLVILNKHDFTNQFTCPGMKSLLLLQVVQKACV